MGDSIERDRIALGKWCARIGILFQERAETGACGGFTPVGVGTHTLSSDPGAAWGNRGADPVLDHLPRSHGATCMARSNAYTASEGAQAVAAVSG